jgi:hypothetical protein
MNTCTQHEVGLVFLPFVCLSPLECDLSLRVVCYFSFLLTQALIKLKPKNYNSPSKHAMNAKDAEMQKLQEYSKKIEKML